MGRFLAWLAISQRLGLVFEFRTVALITHGAPSYARIIARTCLPDRGQSRTAGESPFRKKYEAEGEHLLVLNHLHLMAIQKQVYLELGLEEDLGSVIANDSLLAKGQYKRAWEIVNEEGHDAFVAELQ